MQNADKTAVTPDILDEIGRLAMFRSLGADECRALFAGGYLENRGRGAVLFRQGEEADRFYIVLCGSIELFVRALSRRESVIDVIGRGETFGMAAIFDGGPFPVGAKVVDDARLVVVPAGPFLSHLAENFDLVLQMMASMSGHLRFLVRQIGEFKLKTTGQRLGSFILGLTDNEEGRASVRLPYDKKLLANRLGMKPESLSRALGRLREVGVSGDADALVIADVTRLRRFCQEGEGAGAA